MGEFNLMVLKQDQREASPWDAKLHNKNVSQTINFQQSTPFFASEEPSIGSLVRASIAELLGTMFLVLLGCGACLHMGGSVLMIAIAFGFVIASMVQTIGHVSGCHINPAVTVGLLFCGRISPIRLIYIPAQCLGAMAGAALLYVVLPEERRFNLCTPGLGVPMVQGILIEMLITMVLLLVVCAISDPERSLDVGNAAPIAVGIAITCSHTFAIPLTGASMNPARAVGPAIIMMSFDDHFVYWVGPLVGAILAGLIYRCLLGKGGEEGGGGAGGE